MRNEVKCCYKFLHRHTKTFGMRIPKIYGESLAFAPASKWLTKLQGNMSAKTWNIPAKTWIIPAKAWNNVSSLASGHLLLADIRGKLV